MPIHERIISSQLTVFTLSPRPERCFFRTHKHICPSTCYLLKGKHLPIASCRGFRSAVNSCTHRFQRQSKLILELSVCGWIKWTSFCEDLRQQFRAQLDVRCQIDVQSMCSHTEGPCEDFNSYLEAIGRKLVELLCFGLRHEVQKQLFRSQAAQTQRNISQTGIVINRMVIPLNLESKCVCSASQEIPRWKTKIRSILRSLFKDSSNSTITGHTIANSKPIP